MATRPQTQQRSVVPLSTTTQCATATAQWLLERTEDVTTPTFNNNKLSIQICGEQAFAQIAKDIEEAEHSVDIVCWGFDPAMELVRSEGEWPRGVTWGDLLRDGAMGKNVKQKRIRVRILCWRNLLFGHNLNNMPGYMSVADHELAKRSYAKPTLLDTVKLPTVGAPREVKDRRQLFNVLWYRAAQRGEMEGVSLRTRDGSRAEAKASLAATHRLGRTRLWAESGMVEDLLLKTGSTHHQKTIVIDYDGSRPLAYVMGLNSVTDYWDSAEHKFDDLRRGRHFEGDNADHSVGEGWAPGSSGARSLKPYQDYACRIEGEAIAPVFRNFVQGWNAADKGGRGCGEDIEEAADLAPPPRNLTQNLKGPLHRAQVIRTMPDTETGGERSIERVYFHAPSFARHYIYIENQYFQNADWVDSLKNHRRAFVKACSESTPPVPISEVPALHLIVVMPTPERDAMVPRTHEALNELGHGDSLPNQDKRFNRPFEEHEQYARDLETFEQRRIAFEQANANSPYPRYIQFAPPRLPYPLTEKQKAYLKREVARRSEKARARISEELGLVSLFASLWTYDKAWSLHDTPVAVECVEEAERYKHRLDVWNRDQARRKRIADGWEKDDGTMGEPISKPKPPPDRCKELQNAIARRYREIYIHSKLMIIDDSFVTLGSANLNLRSFTVDSELNIASDSEDLAKDLRKRVWGMHTAEKYGSDETSSTRLSMPKTFERWRAEADDNLASRQIGESLSCFLTAFVDERSSSIRVS